MKSTEIPPGLRFFFIQGGVGGPGLLVFVCAVGDGGGAVGLRVGWGEAGARRRGEAGTGNGPGQRFPHLCWHRAPHLCNNNNHRGIYSTYKQEKVIFFKLPVGFRTSCRKRGNLIEVLTYPIGFQNQFI
jgi:hypothetical protein